MAAASPRPSAMPPARQNRCRNRNVDDGGDERQRRAASPVAARFRTLRHNDIRADVECAAGLSIVVDLDHERNAGADRRRRTGAGSPNDSMMAAGALRWPQSMIVRIETPRRNPMPHGFDVSAAGQCDIRASSQSRSPRLGADQPTPPPSDTRGGERTAGDAAHRREDDGMSDSQHCRQGCPQGHARTVGVDDHRKRRPLGVRVKPAPTSASCTAARSPSAPGSRTGNAVDLLDEERLHPACAHQIGQRRCGRDVRLGVVGEAQQRAATAFEEPHQLTVDERHQRARLAARPVRDIFVGHLSCRPWQRGPVRIGRVCGREHHGVIFAVVRVDTVEVGPQPIHRRGHRELGAAQRFDEVPALASAGVLERRQHLVEHREAAGHLLGRRPRPWSARRGG